MHSPAQFEPYVEAATIEALETMCFSAVVSSLPPSRPGEHSLVTEIHFKGDARGSLKVGLSRTAAQSVASNFLGEEPEAVSQQSIEEVACELTNMICGCMLTAFDRHGRFELSAPFVSQDAATEGNLHLGWQLDAGTMQTWLAVSNR